MARYVDVEELPVFGFDNPNDDNLFEFVPWQFIENAPTADVRENVHGEWVEIGYQGYPCACSVCGISQEIKAKFLFSFCPNCGAYMRKGEENGEEKILFDKES